MGSLGGRAGGCHRRVSRGGGVATTTLGAVEGEVADCSGQSTHLNSEGSGVQAQRCHLLAVCLGASVLTQRASFSSSVLWA